MTGNENTGCGSAVWLSQGRGDGGQTRGLGAAESPEGAVGGRCCPTLAGGAAVSRWGERVTAAQRLTGPVAAGHKASETGTQVAGLSGIQELLAAQVGHP